MPDCEEVMKYIIEMENAVKSGESKSVIKTIFDKLLPVAANVAAVWQVLSQYIPQLINYFC